MNVGVAGLGAMGANIAARLIEVGRNPVHLPVAGNELPECHLLPRG